MHVMFQINTISEKYIVLNQKKKLITNKFQKKISIRLL